MKPILLRLNVVLQEDLNLIVHFRSNIVAEAAADGTYRTERNRCKTDGPQSNDIALCKGLGSCAEHLRGRVGYSSELPQRQSGQDRRGGFRAGAGRLCCSRDMAGGLCSLNVGENSLVYARRECASCPTSYATAETLAQCNKQHETHAKAPEIPSWTCGTPIWIHVIDKVWDQPYAASQRNVNAMMSPRLLGVARASKAPNSVKSA